MTSFFESFLSQVESALRKEFGDCVYRDLVTPLGQEVQKAIVISFGKSDWSDFGSPDRHRVTSRFSLTILSRSESWFVETDECFQRSVVVVKNQFGGTNVQLHIVETEHEAKSADLPVGGISLTYEVTFVVSSALHLF